MYRHSSATLALAVLLPTAAHAVDGITLSDPVSRATPAGAPTGIGYQAITHEGDTPDRLVSASSPAADPVEIHGMSVTEGVMSMRPVPGGLAIPAHGSAALKPGSFHLMLIGPKHPFAAGETIPVTLTFERTGPEQIDLAVKPMGAVPPLMGQ